ncbi:UNVERIFIED_CONTAM: 6-pyruvoyltetrahydropterin/6-carboxytetrahydropterin synthase [Acetivibrio alkalicellulosi]
MKIAKVGISKVFTFDSAHHLIDYKGKCKNIHGHTYKLEVLLKGIPDKNGLVIDFHDLDSMIEDKVLSRIDHKYLNEIFDFNPTCEMIGLWLWNEIKKEVLKTECSLERLILWETPTCFVTIDKEDMD